MNRAVEDLLHLAILCHVASMTAIGHHARTTPTTYSNTKSLYFREVETKVYQTLDNLEEERN